VNNITVPHVLHAAREDDDTAVAGPGRIKGDSKNSLGSVVKSLRVRWLTFQASTQPGVVVTSPNCPGATKIMVEGADTGGIPAFHLPTRTTRTSA
jgi:hypothetical protein